MGKRTAPSPNPSRGCVRHRLGLVKSSEIEGEVLDREQVRSSLARRLGIDIGALAPADRYVEGVVEMMLDATENHDAPLSAERLFAWHAALFPTGRSGMRKITVGAWRTEQAGPMQVVSGPAGRERVHFEAPAASKLDREMKSFLGSFNGDGDAIDPVLKAGIAHLWFLTIHPFEDGNGRIARAIADQQLLLPANPRLSREIGDHRIEHGKTRQADAQSPGRSRLDQSVFA